MALAGVMEAFESTVTLDFHSSRVGSGMGYREIGTLWGLAVGGDNASGVGIGRCRVPMTPPVVQKGGVDRHCVFRFKRDAPGVQYSEIINK